MSDTNPNSAVGTLGTGTLGTGTPPSPDWQARAADTIEDAVAIVHDQVVRPLLLVARGIVFGIVVAAMALVLSVLLAVALVRILDVYVFPGRVWASEALVGLVLTVVGVVAWSLRRSEQDA